MSFRFAAVLSLSALLSVFSTAPAQEQIFDRANQLYLQQKYSEAIRLYEQIVDNGYESGELYFNIGNAYYKSGNIPKAILNYERSRKILPGDEDVSFNLRLANLQVVDKVDPVPKLFIYRWIDAVLTSFPLSTLQWAMYTFFLLTLVSLSSFLLARTFPQKRASLLGGLMCGGLLLLSMLSFAAQSYREANTEFAIVMSDVTNIKSAPDKRSSDLFVLHKGLKVEALDSVNHWRKIRLADGKIGWIREEDCEII